MGTFAHTCSSHSHVHPGTREVAGLQSPLHRGPHAPVTGLPQEPEVWGGWASPTTGPSPASQVQCMWCVVCRVCAEVPAGVLSSRASGSGRVGCCLPAPAPVLGTLLPLCPGARPHFRWRGLCKRPPQPHACSLL